MSERRMDAYYYSFEKTGCGQIDEILSAVAKAGKAFHHTQYWGDEHEFNEGEKSFIDLIQEAANKAEGEITRSFAREVLRWMRAEQDNYGRWIRLWNRLTLAVEGKQAAGEGNNTKDQ